MNTKERMRVLAESSSTLDRIYYGDLSESQLLIQMRRVAVDLLDATEEEKEI